MINQPLPTLIGTPKQVAWAEKIRASKLADIEDALSYLSDKLGKTGIFALSDAKRAECEAGVAERREALGMASASWWIEHRYDLFLASLLNPRVSRD